MGKIILSAIQQPLGQSTPRTNIYEGREVEPGRIRTQFQGGPEIRHGAAAGLASLAQGLSAWTGVARAWSSRKEDSDSEARPGRSKDDRAKGGPSPGPDKKSRSAEQVRPAVSAVPGQRDQSAENARRQTLAAAEPMAGPGSASADPESRDLDLDRASLLEAVRAHDSHMENFVEEHGQLSGRQAIDDPLTGSQGLVGRAQYWIKKYEAQVPKFRRPETEDLYKQIVGERRSELLERAAEIEGREQELWREEVFNSELDLVIGNLFKDPNPRRLADLELEIDTLWPGAESAERRAEIRDGSFSRIALTVLDTGNLNEAEAFINQYREYFKPTTMEELKKALDSKESELVMTHTALAEVLPDLAVDEVNDIMAGGQPSEPLDGLYQTAERFWDLPAEKRAEYQRGREEAQAAKEWLDQPERAFKPFSELLTQAAGELKKEAEDGPGPSRYALVERELLKRRREFNDDPIGHIAAQRDMTLKGLLANGGLDEGRAPEMAQMKIALGRSLAKKMGMEDRGLVLSREEAGQYEDKLAQTAAPSERLELLTEYDKLFGRYSERAFRQLNIPIEEQWAARLFQSGNPEVGRAVRLAFDGLKQMPPDDDQDSWLAMARAASETMMSPRLHGLSGGLVNRSVESDKLDGLCRLVAAAAGPAGAENSLGSANSVESLLVGVLGDGAKAEPAKAGAALLALAELKKRPEDAVWLTEFLARKLAWAEMEKSPEAKGSFLADFRNWQYKKGLGQKMPLPYHYLPKASPDQNEPRTLPYSYQPGAALDQNAPRTLPYSYKPGATLDQNESRTLPYSYKPGGAPDLNELRTLPYTYQPGQVRSLEFLELQGRTEAHRLAEELMDKAVAAGETVLEKVSAGQLEGTVRARDWLDEALHGFGVGTRGILDSFLNIGDFFASPLRMLLNKASESLGDDPNYFQPMAQTIPDALGLPQPENSGELFAYNLTEALAALPLAILTGQMLMARGAQAASSGTAALGEMLAAEPAAQAAAGLGAAGALTAAQEAGANPIIQFISSLFGGMIGGGLKPKVPVKNGGVSVDTPSGIRNNNERGRDKHMLEGETSSGKDTPHDPSGIIDGAKLQRIEPSSLTSAPESHREQYALLVNELIERNVKVSADQVLRVEKTSYYVPEFKNGEWAPKKMPEDSIIFLERGDLTRGLEHIKHSHLDQFVRRGISEDTLADVLISFVKYGEIVGYQNKRNSLPRPIYKYTVNGQEEYMAISVGSNGYIVGANPASKPN